MEIISKTLMPLLILVLFSSIGNAQATIANVNTEESFKLLIPDIQVFIDSALAKNAMLEFRKNDIVVKEANLLEKKRNWTRNFGVQGDARYGTFNNFSSNISDVSTVNLASNTQQSNYSIGVYLKIPFYDIFNRKSEMKQARAEINQAKNLQSVEENQIREKVIRYYEDLILKDNLLEIQASNLSDARVNKEMAKKEFTNGKLPLYEYIRISDITAGIATEFEKAKSNLFLAKKVIENFTGVQIK
ncbi:TolC family protein [Flavobacteriaceae bacterium R38]|nr:TolC family protein [Flavobacteriaceae bacterium R38]